MSYPQDLRPPPALLFLSGTASVSTRLAHVYTPVRHIQHIHTRTPSSLYTCRPLYRLISSPVCTVHPPTSCVDWGTSTSGSVTVLDPPVRDEDVGVSSVISEKEFRGCNDWDGTGFSSSEVPTPWSHEPEGVWVCKPLGQWRDSESKA